MSHGSAPNGRVANSKPLIHHSSVYGLIVMFFARPGVRSGSARRANSQSSERVFLGSMISSTQNFSAERNGERSLLSRFSIRYAWPSAYWGSLPLEGGIEAAYRAEIDAAEDPVAKLKEIEDRLNKLRSPFRSAEKFWVEEIVDPRKTRSLLCEFARLAEPLRTPGLAKNMTIRP